MIDKPIPQNRQKFMKPMDSTLTIPGNKKNVGLTKRDRPRLFTQKSAPAHLRFASQPEGVPIEKVNDYIFNVNAGRGFDLYIPDSGVKTTHREFTYDGVNKWENPNVAILPKKDEFGSLLNDRNTNEDHGTCVASLAGGKLYGVSKSMRIISVKWQDDENGDPFPSSIIDVMWRIVRDIEDRATDKQNKNYPGVNISFGILEQEHINLLREPLKQLEQLDILVGIACGTDPLRKPYPQKFALEFKNIFPSVESDAFGRSVATSPLTGAPDGYIAASTRDPNGDGIVCASAYPYDSRDSVIVVRGSSVAVPQQMAAAAYILSILPNLRKKGQTAQNLIKVLRNDGSHRRRPLPDFPPAMSIARLTEENVHRCILQRRDDSSGENCDATAYG